MVSLVFLARLGPRIINLIDLSVHSYETSFQGTAAHSISVWLCRWMDI